METEGTNYWWEHVYCYKVTEIGLNGHMIGEVNQGESSLLFPHVHRWNWDSLVPKLSSAMGSAPWLARSAFFPSSFPPSNLFSLCACLKGQHTECFSCDFGNLLGAYLSAGCPIRCCERYTDDEATAPAPGSISPVGWQMPVWQSKVLAECTDSVKGLAWGTQWLSKCSFPSGDHLCLFVSLCWPWGCDADDVIDYHWLRARLFCHVLHGACFT